MRARNVLRRIESLSLALVLLGVVQETASPSPAPPALHENAGVSVSIRVDDTGALVAREIELLKEPRSLKLRGIVQAVRLGSIDILGLTLVVTDRTEFHHSSGGEMDRHVEPGEFAEIKIGLDSEGHRTAREVVRGDVKASAKIKGTVTALHSDGSWPDTLAVGGVPVLWNEDTDLVTPSDLIGEVLFADLKAEDDPHRSGDYALRLGSRVFLSGSYRQDFRAESGYSLSTGADSFYRDTEPSLRWEALGIIDESMKFFAQMRFRGKYVLHRPSAYGEDAEDETEIALRQVYLSMRDLGGRRLGAVIGKQRMRDEREFLFDDYLDGIRFYMYETQPLVLEATAILPVVPLKEKTSTWTDLFLRARYYFDEDNALALYALRRWDSDRERIREPRYYGLAFHGRLTSNLRLWVEASVLRGEDKGQALRASGLDVGLSGRLKRWPLRPSLTVGYARGSGDRDPDDGVDNTFRQTGYEDNSSRTWGHVNFQHYGEVLNPELSNLEITTLGLGLRPHTRLSIDLVYHGYRQPKVSEELESTDLVVPEDILDGNAHGVGEALDLIVGVNDLWRHVDLSYRSGVFLPGTGFPPSSGRAFFNQLQVRLEF